MYKCRTAAVLAFTGSGQLLGRQIGKLLAASAVQVEYHAPQRLAADGWNGFERITECTGALMQRADALIFIGAAGIAVRAVAPFAENKLTDPAVLVLDERGQFVIPLLSGHAGGANDLAVQLALALGAQAVLTTATDVEQVFSVDSYARREHLAIVEKDEIKHISGALLQGEPVGALTPECGFVISPKPAGTPFAHTLHLVPQDLVLGMGCRRGVPAEELYAFVAEQFAAQGWSMYRIRVLASVDHKRGEEGLQMLAKRLGVPFVTYPPQRLAAQQGAFHHSAFVRQTVGVDNVCERSALCAAVAEGWLPPESRFEDYVRLGRQTAERATLAVVGLY